MTITISQQTYDELWKEIRTNENSHHPDPNDKFDVMYKFPQPLGRGYWREIQLREGFNLTIADYRIRDRLMIEFLDLDTPGIEYHFHLSGETQSRQTLLEGGRYGVYGRGIEIESRGDISARQPFLEVIIEMLPETLYSLAGNPDGEIPTELQHLVRSSPQECYCRDGIATPAMQTVAKQIIQCPYRGIAKRVYLEGKALELMGMLLAVETEIQDGNTNPHPLTGDLIDRIYYARDILQQKLDNPPSLRELARLVGLNEYTLKQGFRQVFGTTVFGYLHGYCMEQAWQMLQTGTWKVKEVANMVGYNDLTAFGRAFRKKFGIRPRDCVKKFSV
ncbi:helix-turn-helix transcriptional regulator [Komarekiella sp. 'clone 1']|uniref:Helix-turn-helix transcriptional regulator n=1 Tax=Komarekiella delphini-convector SJRDD-AB1 TaxID=2593771 RepID=A0AA40SYQ4_9NOST|nr:AraC family transcriptional regulator [Komarekiella delphini-convector]MBD6617756.1 helix-turn-helix transcriptional regulator [Komarekiella delphini-convector SJRDD-AB1]